MAERPVALRYCRMGLAWVALSRNKSIWPLDVMVGKNEADAVVIMPCATPGNDRSMGRRLMSEGTSSSIPIGSFDRPENGHGDTKMLVGIPACITN